MLRHHIRIAVKGRSLRRTVLQNPLRIKLRPAVKALIPSAEGRKPMPGKGQYPAASAKGNCPRKCPPVFLSLCPASRISRLVADVRRVSQKLKPSQNRLLSRDRPTQNKLHIFSPQCTKYQCVSISSIKIPYPFVESFTSTWVTAPTSFPFWMMGLPLIP